MKKVTHRSLALFRIVQTQTTIDATTYGHILFTHVYILSVMILSIGFEKGFCWRVWRNKDRCARSESRGDEGYAAKLGTLRLRRREDVQKYLRGHVAWRHDLNRDCGQATNVV